METPSSPHDHIERNIMETPSSPHDHIERDPSLHHHHSTNHHSISSSNVNIAVVGCGHGQLDQIYSSIEYISQTQDIDIHLCIITGDFQAARNQDDLLAMAVPPKYRQMGSFYKYYSGEAKAPVPTLFIGGNHEASALSMELWPGGYVAPNIYYMGSAGVIEYAGIRIGGISGIYKPYDYYCGYYEAFPLNHHDQHSVFHCRQYDINRLSKLSSPVDIFLSHDWPVSITDYGDVNQLLRQKPFFREDIEAGRLGNPHLMGLLKQLQPSYWFSGHLHCKFAALVNHEGTGRQTNFLALDKCMPHRRFLQVVSISTRKEPPFMFCHDPEWLSIVKASSPYISLDKVQPPIPDYQPSHEDLHKFQNQDLTIRPEQFSATVPVYIPNLAASPAVPNCNPQVKAYYELVGIQDPMLPKKLSGPVHDPDEIDIDF